MIVDDDYYARRGIISMVPWEKYGMSVVGEAQNGEKALEYLADHPVDLMLIDLEMPVMSGTELMEEARKRYPGLLFVVLTFHENFEAVQCALRLGAMDYISKLRMEEENSDEVWARISRELHGRSRRVPEAEEFADEKDEARWNALEEKWESMSWLYSDSVFDGLCGRTREMRPPVWKMEQMQARLMQNLEHSVGIQPPTAQKPCGTVEEILQSLTGCRAEAFSAAAREACSLQQMPACILRAAAYIGSHIGEPLHAETVAGVVHISRSYFSVSFKKLTGMTFNEFVREERIHLAAVLLAREPVRIADLAREVGYDDANYFTRVFLERVGMTPSEYRRKVTKACG